MIKNVSLVVGLVLLGGRLAGAQSPVLPTSYEVRFFQTATSTTVIASSPLPASVYACNVDPATPFTSGRVTAFWDDPVNVSPQKQCRYVDPGTGAFVQPPPNQTVFVGVAACVVKADNTIGCSPESNRVAYTRTALPGVPTHFGIGIPPAAIATGIVRERFKSKMRSEDVDVARGPLEGPFSGVNFLFGVPGTLPVSNGQRFAIAVW